MLYNCFCHLLFLRLFIFKEMLFTPIKLGKDPSISSKIFKHTKIRKKIKCKKTHLLFY